MAESHEILQGNLIYLKANYHLVNLKNLMPLYNGISVFYTLENKCVN